jgi:hypothetical protein
MKSEDRLTATGPAFDVFSYHTYGAVSVRCKSMGTEATTSQDAALSEDWLSRGGRAGHREGVEKGTRGA